MYQYNLCMTFIAENGESVSVNVPDVNPDITKEEIEALMDVYLTEQPVISKNGLLSEKKQATVTKFAKEPFNFVTVQE